MGKKKDEPTVGYWYGFGIHMGIGRGPVDEMVEIRVGDRTAWSASKLMKYPVQPRVGNDGLYGSDTGSSSMFYQHVQATGEVQGNMRIFIGQSELFGGENAEGGIEGWLDVMMGGPNQQASAGLKAMLGDVIPGYRGMFTVFFNGWVSAMNPYPKAWKFRVRRVLAGWDGGNAWYPEKAKIILVPTSISGSVTSSGEIHAMNPAHILYECLTNRQWGRGLSRSALNDASFVAAADTLYDERLGLCLKWARRDSLQTFVQSVLDHIGGVLYTDRSNALLTLKLIRQDYVHDRLPIFDTTSGLLEITEAVASAQGPTINEVKVKYVDPITNNEQTVVAQNLASMQAGGGVFNSVEKTYSGIPTAELAVRLAQRDLRASAIGVRRFKLVCDRRAWRLAPAGVIRIRDVARGIEDMVLRIGRIEDGTLTNGRITITALQDVFSFPLSSFVGIEPPLWTPPDRAPQLHKHKVIEVPYYMLNRAYPASEFALLGKDVGFVGTLAEKPTPLSLSYDIGTKLGLPTEDEQPGREPLLPADGLPE